MDNQALAEEGGMTVRQVARFIGCSQRTAYRLVWGGTLPSYRVGTRVFVPRVAVVEFIATALEQPAADNAAA